MFPCVRLDGRLCHRFWFLSIVSWVYVVMHLPHSSLCVLNTESPPWPLSAAVPLVARARRRAVRRSGDGSLLSENVVEVIQSRNASCDFRGNSRVAVTQRDIIGAPEGRRLFSFVLCVLRQAPPFGEAPQRQEEREEGPEAPPFPPPYGVCCLIAIELRSGR